MIKRENSNIIHHYRRYLHGFDQIAVLYLGAVCHYLLGQVMQRPKEMNRLLKILIIFIACIPTFNSWGQIYVSPKGADTSLGSHAQPFATLGKALRKARELRRLQDTSISKGIHIVMESGTYQLYEPIFIRPEDAGTPESPTLIEAATNAIPVISGGISIKGWQKVKYAIKGLPSNAIGKVWVADVPLIGNQIFNFRQLWVNGVKALRARDRNLDSLNRIISWNKKAESCWIPTPKTPSLLNTNGIEMFIHQWWEVATLRIKNYEVHGDSTLLTFHQPESKIQSEHPWPAPWISKESGNSAFYLTNAIQFLNEPGEWFLDVQNRKIYYWPRNAENLAQLPVVAGNLETLVNVMGTADNGVSNIHFKGISFSYTGWLRPSLLGHVPHQMGMFMLDAYKLKVPGTKAKKTLENQAWVGRPSAAVAVTFAQNIGFENCVFEHLASTGLDYQKGSHDAFVNGNLFKDIGGNGIQAGLFSDEATEIHLPYQTSNEKEICSNLLITNNLITNVTNEDWGCVGIAVGYTRNTTIQYNDISEVNYTGISLGWGWTSTVNVMKNNHILANKIHHYAKQMYDVGGIYTQSAQPGSSIQNNYIDSIYKAPYAHIPSHWFYLYTDEGTAGFLVKDNWTPSQKFLQNSNGSGNTWQNNGPEVANSIKLKAGIQAPFQYLFKNKVLPDNKHTINKEQPVILEIIAANNGGIDKAKLIALLATFGITQNALFQWQNHYVIFDKVQDVSVLRQKIQDSFSGTEIKTYDDLFYEFNRKYCSDTVTATEWSHTILTANLVANPTLQKEYLNYHATQFQQWPEIAKGFCNAGFQQLLLFKNDRQLMLVISIPKGESLDNLNPKTEENNPRVADWNKLMKKYQEGIPGTKNGTVWVFLEPIIKVK